MLIANMYQKNDGTECEGFGRCTSQGRMVARYSAEVLTRDFSNERVTVRLCEHHVAEHMRMQVADRERENAGTPAHR